MKTCFFLVAVSAVVSADAVKENPLGTVMALMDSLSAKIKAEGEAGEKAFKEFVQWCDETSRTKNNDLKTGNSNKASLEATINKAADDGSASTSKIEELAASIATDTADLKAATDIRKKEAADFAANQAELVDTVDTLGRAISIVDREMSKNPAAFAQVDTTNINTLVKSLSAVVDAASLGNADRQKLLMFVQSQQKDDDDDVGAPAAAVYKSQSGNILDVLEDLKEKAEAELSDLRKAETTAKHNFEMMKQSLEDQMGAENKDMAEEKAAKSAAQATQADAEAELAQTNKDIADGQATLAAANGNCMQTAADWQATCAGREDELATIAKAKEILASTTAGADEQTYSLVQATSQLQTQADLANAEVVAVVKKLALEQHSAALAQLASKMSMILRYAGGSDPFVKVRGLIADMISKLQAEAEADATEKAYCDEQLAKTEAKKSDLDDDIAKLTAKIDQAAAKSAKLKAAVKETQSELAALAKSQAEMDKIRADDHAAFAKAKEELEAGLAGVRKALGVLRDYYGSASASMLQQPAVPVHAKATGAGDGIIDILEVVESDFAKNLVTEETQEADAARDYEKTTQANAVTKTLKSQDVKYNTAEFQRLDKEIGELSADRESAGAELGAVLDYYDKIKARCIAKPETYEERSQRRQNEIAGLKNALSILESETALMQRRKRGWSHGFLRQ